MKLILIVAASVACAAPALANSALLTMILTMQQMPRSGAYQDEFDRQQRMWQEEYDSQIQSKPSAPETLQPCRDLLPSGIMPAPGLDRCGRRK